MNSKLNILTVILFFGSLINVISATKTLTIVADAHVSKDLPSFNFGSSENIGIGYNSDMIGYLKFNLSKIPQNVSIQSAKLKLNCLSSAFSIGSIIITTFVAYWSEGILTFNNQPKNRSLRYFQYAWHKWMVDN